MTAINITTKNFLSEINKFRNAIDKVLTMRINTDKPLIVRCVCKYENEKLTEAWHTSICKYISYHSPYKYNETFFTTMIRYNDATEFVYCINCTLEQYEDVNNILES